MDIENLKEQLHAISKSCEELNSSLEQNNPETKNFQICRGCEQHLAKKLNRDGIYYNNVMEHIGELGELVIFMFLFTFSIVCIMFIVIHKQMRIIRLLTNKRPSRTKIFKLPVEMKM